MSNFSGEQRKDRLKWWKVSCHSLFIASCKCVNMLSKKMCWTRWFDVSPFSASIFHILLIVPNKDTGSSSWVGYRTLKLTGSWGLSSQKTHQQVEQKVDFHQGTWKGNTLSDVGSDTCKVDVSITCSKGQYNNEGSKIFCWLMIIHQQKILLPSWVQWEDW